MTRCELCFHHCELAVGQIGFCRARINRNGVIESLTRNTVVSIALDPIEKKPLAYFYPGSMILSLGSTGCNLRCPFCQNHAISMAEHDPSAVRDLPPHDAVDLALSLVPRGNLGIAFTYNEPLINIEYVEETARLAKAAGLKTVLVTNGTAEEAFIRRLLPLIDAYNIDLKGFTPEFYRKLQGDLDRVKRTITLCVGRAHVEITTLIIEGENDDDATIEAMARWLASLDPMLPLHLTRFIPHYLWMDKRRTSIDTLRRLQSIAQQHLERVHLGNV
jgi:pyruvate formate lyase activating enzyme